ncbi:MAG: ABC transporter ATP-binding protein [Ruminococcus sp.]|nr:ABC transporter ATP-binding protein [Ruminococcus sp.]
MLKLFRYLKNYKKESIIGPLFKLIEACFELAVPLVMKNMIDVGIKKADSGYIYKMGLVLILLGALGLACALTAQYFAAKASLGFATALRRDLFHHINTLSYAEVDKIGSHTLVTRMTSDVNTVQTGVNMLLRLFLRSPFIVIGSVIMAFTITVKVTLIFLVMTVILAFVIYKIMAVTTPRFKDIQKQVDKTNLLTSETLTGARVIRAFSRQENEMADFANEAEDLKRRQIIAGRIAALMNPLTYVIVNIAIIAILWQGGDLVYTGWISQGELIALVNYMNQILLALLAMTLLVTSITRMQASAVRINDVFDIKTSISDGSETEIETDRNAPAVEFRSCVFSYHADDDPELEGISFSVKRGETVGLIGGTGSGKSTLVNLIPRFYDVNSGEVLVDGVNVRKYPLKQLRKRIGIVPQRAVLFKGTIRENMKWRDENASDEEIMRALEIAQAKDFVMMKPDALDTMINQEGKNLSGGQRQRLTIARALIGSPEMLILDDSASALDLATDAALRKAIAEKTQGLTVFIVSQRVSSIRHADKIVVLDDGRIAGIGTHSELIKSCEVYQEICQSQLSAEEAAQYEK